MRSFTYILLFDLTIEKHNNEEMEKSVGPSYGLALLQRNDTCSQLGKEEENYALSIAYSFGMLKAYLKERCVSAILGSFMSARQLLTILSLNANWYEALL
jgi:hypothetical protein